MIKFVSASVTALSIGLPLLLAGGLVEAARSQTAQPLSNLDQSENPVPGLPSWLMANSGLSDLPIDLSSRFQTSNLLAASRTTSRTMGKKKPNTRISPNQFPRIVGGTDAREGDYPFITALYNGSNSSVSNFFCGGSLINRNYVLTAAHCVQGRTPGSLVLEIGNINLNFFPIFPAVTRTVTQIKIHPSYNGSVGGGFDVALLKLNAPVRSLLPVTLWSSTISSGFNTAGTDSTIVGYGTTSEGGSISPRLLVATVPIVSTATCNSPTSYNGQITSTMLCAGPLAGGVDTCQGDSGGPLMQVWNEQRIIGGVTSWGDGCARPNKPGVYARLSVLRNWIVNNLK